MADDYYIDLEQFSLEYFRRILETRDLQPGRMILKEQLAERFQILESMGISNLKELEAVLKTKKRVEKFAQESGLPNDYLVILRREVSSYAPKPFNLEKIPGVNPEYVERLAASGIKHTRHLFERAKFKDDRAELSRLTDVPDNDLLELVRLSDLARIWGVGPVFARLLYEAGVDTIEEFLKCSPEELSETLHAINNEKHYTPIMPTAKDIGYCVELAKHLPRVVEY